MLEKVDEHLLRLLVKGHSKLPKEFLYLEAVAIPIRFIISSRRLLYLQTILKRPEEELIRRVYNAQKNDATPGDFFNLIKEDLNLIGEQMSEEQIQHAGRDAFKKEIKEKIKNAACKYLRNIQSEHSKIRDIQYNKLETQSYLTSPIFYDEEVELLHALRSRYTNVKANFSSKFKNDMRCPLCLADRDDQQHILSCSALKRKLESQETVQHKNMYEDIFADHRKQKEITYLFSRLLKIRNSLLDQNLCMKAGLL